MSPEVTRNDVTGSHRKLHLPEMTSAESEMEGRQFPALITRISPVPPYLSRFFSGTSLDSRYEQWNCESNLYRVPITLLFPMLNHFLNP